MTDFEFLKSNIRPPTTGLHDAFQGELALAESRAEWGKAASQAFREAIERDFRGGLQEKQNNLQRELAQFEEQGRTRRAEFADAGEERRSIRYNDLQREQEDRRRQEFQTEHGDQLRKEAKIAAVQEALGALLGGQGVPQPGPGQRMMGAPAPAQGSILDEAALMSRLDPGTQLNYQQLRASESQIKLAREEKQAAAAERAQNNTFDRFTKLGDWFRTAKREEAERQHDFALKEKEAELRRPKPRDTAIERWKSLGMKPDPGDLLNGRPPETPEAFQARMNSWIDAETTRVQQEQGGGSLSQPGTGAGTATGTTPPAAQQGRTAVSITEQAMAEGWPDERVIKEMTDAGFDPEKDPEEQDAARAGQRQGGMPAAQAAEPAAPKGSPKEQADLALKEDLDIAAKEYADALFALQAKRRGLESPAQRSELKIAYEDRVEEAKAKHKAASAGPKPSEDVNTYRDPSLPPAKQYAAAHAAMQKALADWKASQGVK